MKPRVHGYRLQVPDGRTTFLKYKGQEVWSKLDADTLRKVASATHGGRYIGIEPGTTLDLGDIYQELVASAAETRDSNRRQ